MVSPGCSSRFLLWEADLPSVQLERSGWFVGVCVFGRHSGLSGLHWRKQDPGHPQSPTPATNTTPTEVHIVYWCVCVCKCWLWFGYWFVWMHTHCVCLFVSTTHTGIILPYFYCLSVGTGLHVLTNTCMSLFVFSRVISRAPGLKLVVETLITSLRPIGNIVLICCAFFIVFGILGVQVACVHTQKRTQLKQVTISQLRHVS